MSISQAVTQSKFPNVVFNISGKDARIDMVSEDTETDLRCKFWERVKNL